MADGRYVAIDIGTVTCRMLVADVIGGRVHELAKEYAIVNLGEGVDATGLLSEAAMQRVSAVLERYLKVRERFDTPKNPILKTVTVATSASRDAANAHEFAAMLADHGLELAVIPGSREAALSYAGASSDFVGEPITVMDIGGGSTEVIVGMAGSDPLLAHSFNVGCRRVTERFLHADPPDALELAEARAWIKSEMAWFFEDVRAKGLELGRIVAVAGTATSVVSMREKMVEYDSSRVHGAKVTLDELAEITDMLCAASLAEREQVVGLDPKRALVIVAGMLILQELLGLAGADGFTASESDILQGIVLDAAN